MSADAASAPQTPSLAPRCATIVAVQDDLVLIERDARTDRVIKNEMVLIDAVDRTGAAHDVQLQGEVLRVRGARADVQVYESTVGVGVGDRVWLTGAPLTAVLGPGLLGQVFDGLQNPIETLAATHGVYLPRGQRASALNQTTTWPFHPLVAANARIAAGEALGFVEERRTRHVVCAPFDMRGQGKLLWLAAGAHTINDAIGEWQDEDGARHVLRLAQRWPVRQALAQTLIAAGRAKRLYPRTPLVTGQRCIDTFFPIAQGGSACIPGPFGAGKTILQNLIARFASADIVVVVACGERAGEVVEMMGEFARLTDPRTGEPLMARTLIFCNTSAMPVAAREASVHMGASVAEYYRHMGHDVLLIADSTSRWAQALREMAARLEEIPGEEAYPASLGSEIKRFYERAGVVETRAGAQGSLTIIGAVSPAGGNFEEPVTQATLATVKGFLGLSAERAYRRAYPAIDPLQSWSRYHAQLSDAFAERAGPDWSSRTARAYALLQAGETVAQRIKVTGEDGVSDADALVLAKARFLDDAYLQQDAFDPVDAATPFDRQVELFAMVEACTTAAFPIVDRDHLRRVFAELTSLFKAITGAAPRSPDFIAAAARYKEALAQATAVAPVD